VSFEYGTKHEAPVVTFTADNVGRARFVTLVMPRTDPREPAPDLAVRVDGPVATAEVRHGFALNVRDRVAWTVDGGVAPLGDGHDAVAAWSREARQ